MAEYEVDLREIDGMGITKYEFDDGSELIIDIDHDEDLDSSWIGEYSTRDDDSTKYILDRKEGKLFGPSQVIKKEFTSQEEAEDWMDDNELIWADIDEWEEDDDGSIRLEYQKRPEIEDINTSYSIGEHEYFYPKVYSTPEEYQKEEAISHAKLIEDINRGDIEALQLYVEYEGASASLGSVLVDREEELYPFLRELVEEVMPEDKKIIFIPDED